MMNLTTAKEPYKSKAKRTFKKVLKPAHTKEIDTGEKRVIQVLKENNEREERLIPITKRIEVEAQIEESEKDIDVWIVETTYLKETELHEFTSEEDAQNYYKGFR